MASRLNWGIRGGGGARGEEEKRRARGEEEKRRAREGEEPRGQRECVQKGRFLYEREAGGRKAKLERFRVGGRMRRAERSHR